MRRQSPACGRISSPLRRLLISSPPSVVSAPLLRRAAILAAALGAAFAIAACSPDPTPTPTPTPIPVAEVGDSVAVHYHGALDDGSVFDSSREREPLEFVIGSGQLIDGFDNAVRGLAVGESVTVRLEPEEAYGPHDPALMFDVPLDRIPEGVGVGDQAQLSNGLVVTVVEIIDETATLDANHRLAGKPLTFEIELIEIY